MIPLLETMYFGNTILDYLIFFAFIAGGVILGKIVVWTNENVVRKLANNTKTNLDDIMIELSEKPLIVYLSVFGTWLGWQFLDFTQYPSIDVYFGHLVYMVVALTTAWLLTRIVKAIIDFYVTPLASKTKTDLDDTLIPIFKKLSVFIIYAITIIMILNHFGQEIGPLLAGLGIGGLAFALAAKDMLSNIFGSVTVLMDKPFRVGHRIKIGGVDGFVKEINVRTTRIQTLDNTMIYIPNAQFTGQMLENVTQEPARKTVMNIGLVYNTSVANMKKAVKILNEILEKQEGLNGKHLVYFTEFGDFALKILVIYYIKDKDNILPIKHDVNMHIKERFEKAGLEMAFPTQTIELKK